LQAADPLPPGGVEARDELPNSQAHSEGGTAGMSYVWEQGYAGAAFQAYNSSYGTVAEPDVTIRLKQRRWDFAGAFNDPVAFLQSLKWKLGLSDYEHTEFEGSTPGTIFEQDSLNARVEALHKPVGNIVGAIGYEARRDDLMVTGAEAFLPPSVTLVNSAFLFEEVDLETLRLQFGGRLDNSRLDSSTDPIFGPGLSRRFTTGSGAAGLVYRPGEMYSGALNFAYTQRAPVNQELFANGPHLATGTFEVGNPGLRPEESFGVDLSLRKETGKVTGSATAFYTHFNNFITLVPRGVNDPVDNLPIFDFAGIPADFLGVEASVIFHLIEERDSRMHLELKTDFVHATNTDTSDPLPRIPPWRFGAELEYGWNERYVATVTLLRAQSQDRTAPNELATDGYVMLDIAFTCRLATGAVAWDLLIKGSNLFNEEARLHTSFLKDIAPLAGRGALVALRASY
jgi:iron complex outermembrane recepter protein